MSVTVTLNHTVKRTNSGTVSLTLTAVAFGMSSKVFAIEVMPTSADAQAPYYRFSHVCSPAELVEFPEDEPMDNCYFRTDCIEMIFDTYAMVNPVIDNVEADIKKLIVAFNALEQNQGNGNTCGDGVEIESGSVTLG